MFGENIKTQNKEKIEKKRNKEDEPTMNDDDER